MCSVMVYIHTAMFCITCAKAFKTEYGTQNYWLMWKTGKSNSYFFQCTNALFYSHRPLWCLSCWFILNFTTWKATIIVIWLFSKVNLYDFRCKCCYLPFQQAFEQTVCWCHYLLHHNTWLHHCVWPNTQHCAYLRLCAWHRVQACVLKMIKKEG